MTKKHLLIPVTALAGACLGFSYYAYRTAFYVPKVHPADPEAPMPGEQYEAVAHLIRRATQAVQKHRFESVEITAKDGCRLHGKLYVQDEKAPVQIIIHGYRSCAYRDCCGGHTLAWKMGCNTLLIDQRAHGDSQGRAITFGILERYDCLEWVKYICERFGAETPIILCGLSMGAATVLSALNLPLPQNVKCVIADSPYDSPGNIIRKVCADEKLPEKIAFPFVRLGARIFGGFNLCESSAAEAIKEAKIPVLIIHGEDDRFVPCQMSRNLQKLCPSPCTLVTVPDAGHGLAYMTDPEGYENAVYQFLRGIPGLSERILGNPIQKDT